MFYYDFLTVVNTKDKHLYSVINDRENMLEVINANDASMCNIYRNHVHQYYWQYFKLQFSTAAKWEINVFLHSAYSSSKRVIIFRF